jgi:O-antigen ligase
MNGDPSQSASRRDFSESRRVSTIYVLYLVALIISVFWIGWLSGVKSTSSPLEWTKIGSTPSLATVVVCIAGLLALAAVPYYPPTGLLICLALTYGFARYTSQLEFIYVARLPEIVLAMSLAGWCIWNQWQGGIKPAPHGFAALTLLCLLIWELLTASIATITTNYWPPHLAHDPMRLLDAGIAFFISATCLTNRRDLVTMVIVLAGALIVREYLWREMTYLDGDISALLAITIPLVLGAITIVDRVPAKLALSGVAVYMTWLLYTTQNRAAGIAFLAALIVLWLSSPRKIVVAGITLVLIFAAAPHVRQTHYWQRFESEIFHDGRFVGSAESRLEIWEATWNVVRQRPVLGTGPGSISRIIGEDPKIGHYFAHNNYLELLAEIGVPGLFFYLVFFATTIYSACRLQRESSIGWASRFAKYLVASLAAYLTCGMFISREDLILAYIVAGIVLALTTLSDATEANACHSASP